MGIAKWRQASRALRCGTILALAALPAFAVAGIRPARHAVTIDDILAMRSLSEMACAPDGRQAAYVVSDADVKTDKRRSVIWLADLAGRPRCS
jgi:hypothetical protein